MPLKVNIKQRLLASVISQYAENVSLFDILLVLQTEQTISQSLPFLRYISTLIFCNFDAPSINDMVHLEVYISTVRRNENAAGRWILQIFSLVKNVGTIVVKAIIYLSSRIFKRKYYSEVATL